MNTSDMINTENAVRAAFWLTFFVEGKPRRYYGVKHNDLPADLRAAFVDYVDNMAREGVISERLASSVTL